MDTAAPALNSQSLSYVEDLYESFLKSRDAVPAEWAAYFDAMHAGEDANGSVHSAWSADPPFPSRSIFNPAGAQAATSRVAPGQQRMDVAATQERLDQLIRNFRVRGHIAANLDPLAQPRSAPPELDPAFYEFTEEDMDHELSTKWVGGPDVRTLRGIINWLKTTYCRSIGVQFMHIDSLRVREWLQEQMEATGNRLRLKHEEQVRILKRLADAVIFEEFLSKKFVGYKFFSLEGAETLIPLLDMAIEKAGNEGVREVVIGMAHRGRLNVLANVLQKSPRLIFREFDDNDPQLHFGHGDVKYHLGYSSDWFTTENKKVHLSLCFNPSHLEFVNTVAQGRIRAKQDRFRDFRREHGMCILVHGDAAFAGEGIVQETLNLSELKGYKIGGTLHIILNNQVGFTTSPDEGRSTTYASDVAKMLQSPIFHVNGEDPEAVAQVLNLALDFRRKFRRDVVIDMYCYRRRGHNEGDEPEFTQPLMYKAIKERKSVYEAYLEHLQGQRGVTREEAEKINEERRARLDTELTEARREDFVRRVDHWGGIWSGFMGGPASQADHPDTSLPAEKLSKILEVQTIVPEDFAPHPKIVRLLEARREMSAGKRPLDWGAAELLAFGSILVDGRPIRFSGQDVRRGTFSHRHAVLSDYEDGHTFKPLKNIEPERGRIEIYNSPLSEAGVLGFEYGYSLDCPEGLVMWEAQFGDFCNAAQVIIDQFITSAEDKWDRLSNLVLLLPHGYEGQGPEHSSARLERFLSMAADDNYQIVQPSTPAQMFHLLRRQVLRKWKKPLCVMTPKSLLRLPACTSSLEDCATGGFRPVLNDTTIADPSKVNRILLCSGRVYYDLAEKRAAENRDDIAIVRVEEFYPLPKAALQECLSQYPEGTPVLWVQDEPENMGAGRFMRIHFGERLFNRYPMSVVSRPASASPATGSHNAHKREQARLLQEAFT
ncbi:MAG: 2-oxoglutarate dehydrogenase E1 component [Planctomyces sp.]|nr:2-oxoglutarate dehydrogenase E1 component [Planctomyces sp.]